MSETPKAWLKDHTKAEIAFKTTVWPVVAAHLGDGQIIATEPTSYLDRLAGIDWLQVLPDGGLRGLASRIQFGPTNWASFTMRLQRSNGATTEASKRQRDIKQNYLHPSHTIQAYVDGEDLDQLISVAVIKTADLLAAKPSSIKTNPADKTRFLIFDWATLVDAGFDLFIYEHT